MDREKKKKENPILNATFIQICHVINDIFYLLINTTQMIKYYKIGSLFNSRCEGLLVGSFLRQIKINKKSLKYFEF